MSNTVCACMKVNEQNKLLGLWNWAKAENEICFDCELIPSSWVGLISFELPKESSNRDPVPNCHVFIPRA